MDITLQQVWNKLVPLKVTTFVWKLMQNRVPTKDNLIKRGTLRDTESICPACSQMEESANHLFFECDVTYKAWAGCLNWLGVTSALHRDSRANFLQFMGLVVHCKIGKSARHAVWCSVVWSIWKASNNSLFKSQNIHVDKVVEEFKIQVWGWLQASQFCLSVVKLVCKSYGMPFTLSVT